MLSLLGNVNVIINLAIYIIGYVIYLLLLSSISNISYVILSYLIHFFFFFSFLSSGWQATNEEKWEKNRKGDLILFIMILYYFVDQ